MYCKTKHRFTCSPWKTVSSNADSLTCNLLINVIWLINNVEEDNSTSSKWAVSGFQSTGILWKLCKPVSSSFAMGNNEGSCVEQKYCYTCCYLTPVHAVPSTEVYRGAIKFSGSYICHKLTNPSCISRNTHVHTLLVSACSADSDISRHRASIKWWTATSSKNLNSHHKCFF